MISGFCAKVLSVTTVAKVWFAKFRKDHIILDDCKMKLIDKGDAQDTYWNFTNIWVCDNYGPGVETDVFKIGLNQLNFGNGIEKLEDHFNWFSLKLFVLFSLSFISLLPLCMNIFRVLFLYTPQLYILRHHYVQRYNQNSSAFSNH